jgi:ATP-dependent Clp protease ATP-binding subunit ClpA
MWNRFTAHAKEAVYYAQQQAETLGENFVGAEHLLIGVLTNSNNLACRCLSHIGIPITDIQTETQTILLPGPGRLSHDMMLAPASKRAIDYAYDEAVALGDQHIGTEHLLLGLIQESNFKPRSLLSRLLTNSSSRQSTISNVLETCGVRLESVRLALQNIRGDHLLRASEMPKDQNHLLRPAKGTEEQTGDTLLRFSAQPEAEK